MLLTENVEVFVTSSSEPTAHFAEYLPQASRADYGQHYIPVVAGQAYYITVIFDKAFAVDTSLADHLPTSRVIAYRIKVIIDGGIAAEERVYTRSDVICGENSGRQPAVHKIDLFDSKSTGSPRKIRRRRCRLQFERVPDSLHHGIQLPAELNDKIGHIDIEFERGYLDFGSGTPKLPHILEIPDAFNPRYYVSGQRNDVLRTKPIRHDSDEPRNVERGVFKPIGPKKEMRFCCYSKARIEYCATVGSITKREKRSDLKKLIATAGSLRMPRRDGTAAPLVPTLTPYASKVSGSRTTPKSSQAPKRKADVIDLTGGSEDEEHRWSRTKKAKTFAKARVHTVHSIDLTRDLAEVKHQPSSSRKAKTQLIDLTDHSFEVSPSASAIKTTKKRASNDNVPIPVVLVDDVEPLRTSIETAKPATKVKPVEVETSPCKLTTPRQPLTGFEAMILSRMEPQARHNEKNDHIPPTPVSRQPVSLPQASSLLPVPLSPARLSPPSQNPPEAMRMGDSAPPSPSPLPPVLRSSPGSGLPTSEMPPPNQPRPKPGTKPPAPPKWKRGRSIPRPPALRALPRQLAVSRPFFTRQPLTSKSLDSLLPIDQSAHVSTIGVKQHERKSVSASDKMYTLQDREIKVRMAKHAYDSAQEENKGNGDSDNVIRIRIEELRYRMELVKREMNALQARLDARRPDDGSGRAA